MITMNIIGENITDIRYQLEGFLDGPTTVNVHDANPASEPVEQPEEPVAETAEEPKPKKRAKRRSKAEIKADEMREQNKDEQAGIADECRAVIDQIEKAHGIDGVRAVAGLIKALIIEQDGKVERVKLSALNDTNMIKLKNELDTLLEAGVG